MATSARPPAHPVRVRWTRVGTPPRDDARAPLVALLDVDERERYRRFRHDRDRWTFLVAHALVRRALSEVDGRPPAAWRFVQGPHGRPEVADAGGPRFNLSHTDGLVACLVTAELACGVDVERVERSTDVPAVARRMFASAEVDAVLAVTGRARRVRFARTWTLKEAYVKARGTGLVTPTREFELDLDGPEPRVTFLAGLDDDPARWRFGEATPTEEHRLAWAVASEGRALDVRLGAWPLAELAYATATPPADGAP